MKRSNKRFPVNLDWRRVFDGSKGTYSNIADAFNAAKSAGYEYFTWNDRVYMTHTEIVTKRVLKYTPDDTDLILAAIFHDLGKIDTLAFTDAGIPTAHGHEKVSAELVEEWGDWIRFMGGDVVKIKYIVRNHMRVKNMEIMRPVKKDEFILDQFFVDLFRFSQHDKGGTKI